jgi:hypothetical protein
MSGLVTTGGEARIELVDEWHREWPRVLDFIERTGQRQGLQVSPAGWVSARQAVLAAFIGDQVVGHLAFHIEPLLDAVEAGGEHLTLLAKLDACAVAHGYDEQSISERLRMAAVDWAQRIHVDPQAVVQARVA